MISRTSSEGGRIPACLDYDSYYSNDSVIIATKWSERILEHQKPKNEWKVSDSKDSYSMQYIAGLINSSLLSYYFTNFYATDTLQGTYSSIYPEDVRNLPIRRIEKDNKQKEEIIVKKVRLIMNKKSQASKINLNIEDYLGKYTFGKKLGDLYTPIKGLSESIFIETTADKENLRIARIAFEEDNGLILKLSARFKPVNKQEFDDLDYWGYKETDFIPVMKFSVDGKMKVLIREFTKLAVDKANGFANFRKNATKSTSLIDRLEQLTLPKLEDVESGLRKYIEQKERSEELKEEIYNIDILIDAIVFKLYKLDDDEVKVILLSLDIKEKIREDIIEKFRGIE
ncbi:unnamed protein product [marine sediment metagenome]|uniref:Uncharacterized protein n=1 Tax=marine sediment metagenome TaxID=412755 RepID=X1F800_9ZZZZ